MEVHGLPNRSHQGTTDCGSRTWGESVRKATIALFGLAALAFGVGIAHADGLFGLSLSIGQPGFYGRIDIGGYPPPELIYGRPIIAESDDGYPGRPIYLHVPPGWARHWGRHCAQFRACHRPVYFVREGWYNDVYVPRYRHDHDRGWGGDHGDDGHWRNRGYDARGDHGGDGHWRNRDRGGPGRGDDNHDH